MKIHTDWTTAEVWAAGAQGCVVCGDEAFNVAVMESEDGYRVSFATCVACDNDGEPNQRELNPALRRLWQRAEVFAELIGA